MMSDALLNAEERCRSAGTIQSLAFTIVNETWQVLPYRQAQFWRERVAGMIDLEAVSGLASLAEDSPFTVWAKRLMRRIWPQLGGAIHSVDFSAIEMQGAAPPGLPALTPDLVSGWEEWWPANLVIVPLARGDECLGVSLILLDEPPDERTLAILGRLQSTWSYCAWALGRSRRSLFRWKMPRGRGRWIAAAVVAGLMAIPTRQAALAPAEIIALDGIAIAAPLEGVIKKFNVEPNQRVTAGTVLFSLDDTTLRNRREVTARALEVAGAELLSAQQRAFNDPKARNEVAVLRGRIAERRAELEAVQEQLARIDITAPRDGIAVFSDVNDWQGKPVVTGERVMQLADPQDMGVLLFLPVADAIALEEGAPIRLFLHVAPLSPIDATLTQTSYQAVLSPESVASYRLRGTIDNAGVGVSRIGLKGTAKVYGESVPLIYYLLRRPIASMRQWSGL